MLKKLYITNRFFVLLGICIFLFLLSYSYPGIFQWAKYFLAVIIVVALIDWLLLVLTKSKIEIVRKLYSKLSLGDEQTIEYIIQNDLSQRMNIEILDEFPKQLQERSFAKRLQLKPSVEERYNYYIRPLSRGEYLFGDIQAYLSRPFPGLIEVKMTIDSAKNVAVVPSVIQMKKFELQVFSKTATMKGIRRIRQIGENDEFEHIRAYNQGDNIKAINWKATSRKNQLMVNQYQNSRSQMVYTIIDKGRSMKMPFKGLTLLDYAINTSLVISNIILRKYDKAGLITFSDKIGAIVKAEASQNQLEKISDVLYNQKTGFSESNFQLLFFTLRKQLSRRSIILFFTNFEHAVDLERSLPYLKSLNKNHLLVVISFINTELIKASEMNCESKSDIYYKTFAQKTLIDKEKIMNQFEIHGIQNILTKPEDLSINVINKYLEIKAKRMK